MSKSFKQWLLAILLVFAIVMVFDWLFNARRLQKNILHKSVHHQETTK